ncbi:MAG: hypothetical protein AAF125_12005 [Chloroflexota bacterium]
MDDIHHYWALPYLLLHSDSPSVITTETCIRGNKLMLAQLNATDSLRVSLLVNCAGLERVKITPSFFLRSQSFYWHARLRGVVLYNADDRMKPYITALLGLAQAMTKRHLTICEDRAAALKFLYQRQLLSRAEIASAVFRNNGETHIQV